MWGCVERIPSWQGQEGRKKDGDGHLFWDCTFPPIQHVRDLPEFAYLMSLDRSNWPRCFLWHGSLVLMALVLRTLGLPPLGI